MTVKVVVAASLLVDRRFINVLPFHVVVEPLVLNF